MKKMTMPRITWGGLKYALFNSTNRAIYVGPLVLTGVAVIALHFGAAFFGILLGGLAFVALMLLIGSSIIEYNVAEANNKFALLTTWAQSASTPEERALRWDMMQSRNLDDVWDESKMSLTGMKFNTDGTMMMPGNMNLDINGNVYGQTDLSTATFNNETLSWTDPLSSYTSPLDNQSSSGFDSNRFD